MASKKRQSKSFMTEVTRGWQSSYNFFEPKEFTPLLLVSVNTVLRSLTPLGTYFSWWLLLWGCCIDLYVDGTALFGSIWEYMRPLSYSIGMAPRLYVATIALITFVILLTIRSSLEAKHMKYYLRQVTRFPLFFLLFAVIPHLFIVPVFWLCSFFFFDEENSVRGFLSSLYNGGVLYLAYAPVFIILGAMHGILFHLHRMLWETTFIEEYHFFAYVFKYGTSMLVYLFFVSMMHTLYSRIVMNNSTNQLFRHSR